MGLYQKYRPKTFEDVVGQQFVKTILTNQILNDSLSHAYLFTGTRGIGKTTIARILARMVNGDTSDGMNIIEIDGASNNGVDNIRDIRQDVNYKPSSGRFKIYIIDEVHMLSSGAFNALLKTLEEPPEHVIFMMCTTEPHKIPPTILSRCQRYDLQRFDVKDIYARLVFICGQENLKIEDTALKYIARLGKGSMRDAISILDQVRNFKEDLSYNDVLFLLGSISIDTLVGVMDDFNDGIKVIKTLKEIYYSGVDLRQFIKDLFNYANDSLLVQKLGDAAIEFINTSEDYLPKLREHSKIVDFKFLETLQELESTLRYSDNEYLLVQNTFLKMSGAF